MADAAEVLKGMAVYAGCIVAGTAIAGLAAYGIASCECAYRSFKECLDPDEPDGFRDVYRRNWRSLMDRPIGGMNP